MAAPEKPGDDYWRLRPRAPALGTVICGVDDIEDPGAREFIFGRGTTVFSMFVVRKDGVFYGYLNICPHYSSPLNCREGEFLNDNRTRIRCNMHFAEFRIEDGFGVAGAAENCWLDPVPVSVRGNDVVVGR